MDKGEHVERLGPARIPAALKALRERKGIAPTAMAAHIQEVAGKGSLSRQSVYDYESGEKFPSERVIATYAAVLAYTLPDFLRAIADEIERQSNPPQTPSQPTEPDLG